MAPAGLGWDASWQAALDATAQGATPARVVRHLGAGLEVGTAESTRTVMFAGRLDPEPVVGDWVALDGSAPVAVLPRRSLLRRRTAHGDDEQGLAANVDTVLLVCGLDRPVRAGRLQREAALAADAGAASVVVLTKAATVEPGVVDAAREATAAALPGTPVALTSVKEGHGVDELRALVRGHTVVLLGESGAGKSTIVNTLAGADVMAVGDVRSTDAKGRHTTTSRQLLAVPGGGVVIDTPGIRAVGLWIDPEAVDAAFEEVEAAAGGCRFADCRHETEPGCAVNAAVAEGTLDAARVLAWKQLRTEAQEAADPPRRRGRRRR